jgi:hypothetical protein
MSTDNKPTDTPFVFPKWVDDLRPLVGLVLGLAPVYIILLVWFGLSPKTQSIGYSPEQPVPFSHAVHAGELGLDCRYCHNTVEYAAHAAVPPTATCMGCHTAIKAQSEKLEPIRSSSATGMPVSWIRVHDLPDYVYFDHSAHLTAGVSCVECHGRVDRMEEVHQVSELSMGWCLDCHRNPAPRLRPAELVTDLGWTTDEDREALGARLMEQNDINPRTDCSTCHR